MKKKKTNLEEAITAFNKFKDGLDQCVHQYLNDRSPKALEPFIKNMVIFREGLISHMEHINRLDSSQFKKPHLEVSRIIGRADQQAKRIVYGTPTPPVRIFEPDANGQLELTKVYSQEIPEKKYSKRLIWKKPINAITASKNLSS